MKITDDCTGCGACIQLCSKHAISMVSNEEGFKEVVIDNNKCVHCGLCEKRCPQNSSVLKNKPLKVYVVSNKNIEELKYSSSGGAFVVLSKFILNEGGCVFGAAYSEEFEVLHIGISAESDLFKLQGSKYVQSDTLFTFKEVKTILEKGRSVLYTGTPCQIAGLKTYLGKDYSNLYTIDLICHGVSSPLLFSKYLDFIKDQYGGDIKSFNFRDKIAGWGLSLSFYIKNKRIFHFPNSDPYYYHFLLGDNYRESCYKCRYCTCGRVGDFTIGDFWGVKKEHPSFNYLMGASACLINTEKALALFGKIKGDINFQESSFIKVSRYNSNLLKPTIRLDSRNSFYQNINSLSAVDFFKKLVIKKDFLIRFKSLIPPSFFFLKKKIVFYLMK